MNRIRTTGLAVLAGLVLAACISDPVRFPEVKQSAVDGMRGRPIRASACGFQLLLFIPISINERFETAFSRLKDRARGGIISDISVREKWFYGFVGTGYCTELVATAWDRDDWLTGKN